MDIFVTFQKRISKIDIGPEILIYKCFTKRLCFQIPVLQQSVFSNQLFDCFYTEILINHDSTIALCTT